MDDPRARESAHLAEFAQHLGAHGLSPQPTGLRVTGDSGESAVILCRPRPDDGDKLWFFVPRFGRWLSEADQPTWALTALKGLLSDEADDR